MDDLEPTNKKPLGKMGKKLDKQFTSAGVNLKEVDAMLSEKEQSFKKKFWDLPKMESLVHSDPILSAEYQEMSEDGQEKYGYHYNETIMNMLFNKYVTNDQGYQQKYLNAIPAEKERRDKSGIHQLQQKGEEKMKKRASSKNEDDVRIHNNSLEGVIEEDIMDNNLNTDGGGTFDDREYLNHRIEKNYDTMNENIKIPNSFVSWFTGTVMYDLNHPNYGRNQLTSQQIKYSTGDFKNQLYKSIMGAIERGDVPSDILIKHNIQLGETTGSASSGAFSTALGAKNNVYENEEQIDETTTSASSGAYEGPFRKKGKNHITNKPIWKGGIIIGENYLTDNTAFKKLYESFGEGNDDTLVGLAENGVTPDMLGNVPSEYIQRSLSELLNNPLMSASDLVKMFQQELRKRGLLKGGNVNEDSLEQGSADLSKIDNTFIQRSLSDLLKNPNVSNDNPLVLAFQQELRNRGLLNKPSNDPKSQNLLQKMGKFLKGESVEMNEHHLDTREEKIQFIIDKGQNKFGDAAMLADQDDETINKIYVGVEKSMKGLDPDANKSMEEGKLRESIGSLKKLSDFAKKYNIQPTGIGGKFGLADLTPVLENPIDEDDKYDLAMYFAERILGVHGLGWDDLGDINSLWTAVENYDGNMKSFVSDVKDLVDERLSDAGSDGMFGEGEVNEKAVSKKQQQFFGMVDAFKKGKMPDASNSIKKTANSMSDKDVNDFASTKHKGLPNKVEEDGKQRRFFTYGEALNLAKILSNAPVEDEEAVLQQFTQDRELSLDELKDQINNHIQSKLAGSESPDFFKMENLITIIDDMIYQTSDQTKDMVSRVKQDKEYEKEMSSREPNLKMQKAGEKAWNSFNPMGESLQEDVNYATVNEIAGLLQKLFPNQYDSFEGFKNFAHLTVKTFFKGDYNKALQGIKSKMGSMLSNEGILSGTQDSMIKDNATSMASTMKNLGGGLGEGDNMNDLKSHGRSDDLTIDSENSLDEFGKSDDGFGGFNKSSEGNIPNFKEPQKLGAPRNKELSKYNKMTEGIDKNKWNSMGEEERERVLLTIIKDPDVVMNNLDKTYDNLPNEVIANLQNLNESHSVCENCGSQLDEDGHCRRDEVPVAGKIATEKGSCKKKKSGIDKADDNEFNVKFRKKKEKEIMDKRQKGHDDYKKEIDKNKMHMKKLKEMVEGVDINEDKRPSALVQMDRLHKDNEKNFNADLKGANTTGEVSKLVSKDELTAGEQTEEVPKNPYELGEKIEAEKMKEHDFKSFDNIGNSTNDTNKDIPKRNMTDEEANDLMLNRGLGMQDIVYDNKPDERFEKRMEKDMGETIYDQRQEKMKFRSDAPMYNKDTEPVAKGTKETQFDKNISKFNSPKGIKMKENHILSAKYNDQFGKRKIHTFDMNEATEVTVGVGVKLHFDGMGNTYTQSVNENTEMRSMMDSWEFYMNGGKVNKVAIKGKQSLTENDIIEKPVNKELEKMMKLAGYKPSDHVNTAGTKKNAKFNF